MIWRATSIFSYIPKSKKYQPVDAGWRGGYSKEINLIK